MPGGDVGQWLVEEPVEPAEQCAVQLREGVAFGVVERGQVGDGPVRVDVHLHRPPGGLGHERGPVLVLQHHARPLAFGGQDVLEQVAAGLLPVGAGRGHHVGGAGGDERQRVDLTVRVVHGHPDLLTPVLEAVHLLDSGLLGERRAAVGPGVDDGAHACASQPRHRGVVVGGETEDLAAALVPAERGEAVFERDHVVVGGGDLGVPVGGGGAQRALVAGRQVGAALAVGGHHHLLAGQGVPAQLGAWSPFGQVARVVDLAVRVVGFVEVDDLPAVGQARGGLSHPVSRGTSATTRLSTWS